MSHKQKWEGEYWVEAHQYPKGMIELRFDGMGGDFGGGVQYTITDACPMYENLIGTIFNREDWQILKKIRSEEFLHKLDYLRHAIRLELPL